MFLRKEKPIVLWPVYFDSKASRKAGRRVSKEISVSTPEIENIAKAAASLGYDVVTQKEKAHPSTWWQKSGRVLVKNPRRIKKNKIIKDVAERLKTG